MKRTEALTHSESELASWAEQDFANGVRALDNIRAHRLGKISLDHGIPAGSECTTSKTTDGQWFISYDDGSNNSDSGRDDPVRTGPLAGFISEVAGAAGRAGRTESGPSAGDGEE